MFCKFIIIKILFYHFLYKTEPIPIYMEKRSTTDDDLIIANRELAFQKDEKGKRARELVIANRELAFQNKEKGKRAEELIVANKELAFQNKEKGKRAEELTAYKHFFYNSMDLACFATLDGYFEEINESFTTALGYTAKELTEKTFLEFVHPDDIEATLNELASQSLGVQTFNFTNRFKTKAGNYLHIEWNSVFNQDTQKIYATGRDISEKIVANEELAFQNEEKGKRADELIIANKELAFQNEEKGKRADELIIANKELAFQNEEKGKRADELIIANKELAFQNEEKGKRADELIIANKELAFQNEEKGKRADELIIANKELAFQNEEKGKRAAELSIANAELKKAEAEIRKFNEELEQKVIDRTEQLEAVNKELGSFSYSVSHDLRAPIRAINGYARILEDDYAGKFDEDGTVALNAIIRNSKKMGQLIDDLLAFSKLGRKEVTVSNINMKVLVKSVKDDLLFDDKENKTEFKIDTLPPAKGDQSLIKQVWINLISNAIKYSKNKAGATVEIGASEKGNEIVYYVKDNGAGFDMQYYDKLFGVFQRLHSQEEFEGTGIGLAIVQKIVSRHKGSVWAESILDKGATFYFSLPDINS